MKRVAFLICAIGTAVVTANCGSKGSSGAVDSGMDATMEGDGSQPETGPESGREAGPDSTMQDSANETSTSDAGAGGDAGDGSGDAGDSGDASDGLSIGVPEAGPDAGLVTTPTSCWCPRDAGACDAGCAAGAICVRYQAVGGFLVAPNDAGTCPPGRVMAPELPGCWEAPSFACVPRPAACGSATPSCACAASICTGNPNFYTHCFQGQGSDLSCVQERA
jgi:hypothetical protein